MKSIVKYRHADLEFTDGAIRQIALIAHDRGTGARGLRAVVESVLEGVLYDPRPSVAYVVTEETIRGGEVRTIDPLDVSAGPLRRRMARRAAV